MKTTPTFRRAVGVLLTLVLLAGAGCTAEAKKERALKRAVEHLKAGKRVEAKIEALNVLKLDPANGQATEMLARIFLEQGALLRAYGYLQKQVERAPTNRDARYRMAEVDVWLGKTASAHANALKLLERNREDGEALLILLETARTGPEMAKVAEYLPKNPGADVGLMVVKAMADARGGDLAGARRLVQRAIATDPKSSAAHFAMGKLHTAANETAEADKAFKQASELAPARSFARLRYAQYKLSTGALEAAAAEYQAVAKAAPDFVLAQTGEAETALMRQQVDRAAELAQAVLKQDPMNYDAVILQARVLLARKDIAGAIALLEKVGAAINGLAADKYFLSRAYLAQGDRAKATAALQQAVRANPDNEIAILELAQLFLLQGQREQAAAMLAEVIPVRPTHLRAQGMLLDTLRGMGKYDEAAKLVEYQQQAMPSNPGPRIAMGVLLRDQNKLAEARASFEAALKLVPNNPAAVSELIDLDLREKRFDAATQRAADLMTKLPASADAAYLAGRVASAREQWTEAESKLLRAIELNANHAGAYDLLLFGYVRGKRLDAGAARVGEMLAKRADDVPALVMGAMIAQEQRRFEQARDYYEKALAARPNIPLALNNLAYLYSEHLNNLERGEELATKLHQLDPTNAPAADTLGWILYKKKEYPKAVELIEQSAARMKNSGEVQYHLGKAYEAVGEKEKARAAYEQAVKAGGDYPGKVELMQRLAAVGGVAKP